MIALLASIPSPDRGVWHIGVVPIRAYALCIIVGIIVAIWWGERRFVARGGQPGTITDIAVFAVPFGLVGGRLYHVLTDWQKYFGEGGQPADALKIWQGGLGIWGAISLGALGAWIGARRKRVPLTVVADACAPGIVVAQAIGRLGNWFNQELFGGPTSLPWGLEIFRRIDPVTGEQDTLAGVADGNPAIAIVHPTFLYELLWNLAVAALIVAADRRYRLGRGRVFALYVAGYTVGRFWIELLRTDPATMVFGVRINVITSVVVFLGAVAYLALVRGPREELAPAGDAQVATDAGEQAEPDPEATGTSEADGMGDAEATAAVDRTAEDRTAEDKAAAGRTAEDRTAEDKAAAGRTAEDRTAEDRAPADSAGGDSVGGDKAGDDRAEAEAADAAGTEGRR